MLTSSFALDFVMKFVDVIPNSQNNALSCDIFFPAIKISTKLHVFFYVCKGTLCLNAPIHSQLCTVFAGYSFQCFLTLLFHLFGNVQDFLTFFYWGFAVVAFDTFCFVWTIRTITTLVYSNGSMITACSFFELVKFFL